MERLYGDGDGVREREGVYAGPPLLRSMSATLAEHDVQVPEQWVEVVGAVIGRDDDAIRAGVAATLNVDEGTAAFFPRLQLDTLSVQSAMLILRQCGVPKMNYALRCMPPPCVEQQATTFDELVMDAARSKLLLHVDEVHAAAGKAAAARTSTTWWLRPDVSDHDVAGCLPRLGGGGVGSLGCASVRAVQPAGLRPALQLAASWLDRGQHAGHRRRDT